MAEAPTVNPVVVGQGVQYTDTQGRKKAAIVVATPESFVPSESLTDATGLTSIPEGHVNLLVISPLFKMYPKVNVPYVSLQVVDPETETVSSYWE